MTNQDKIVCYTIWVIILAIIVLRFCLNSYFIFEDDSIYDDSIIVRKHHHDTSVLIPTMHNVFKEINKKKEVVENKNSNLSKHKSKNVKTTQKDSKIYMKLRKEQAGNKSSVQKWTPSNQCKREGSAELNISFDSAVYPRGEVNHEPRNSHNDVLKYIYSSRDVAHPREMEFQQAYNLEFFMGSTHVGNSGFPGKINPQHDFTIISQTTKERLFFFPLLLNRWQGQLCIVIFLEESDVNNAKKYIVSNNFPDRLHLILYIVNPTKNRDCVYHKRYNLNCKQEKIYPINRLRNIAINNIQTTHFIVFDMDMWPSKHLYETLHNLPSSYLESPHVVTIIPAFSLPESILKSPMCNNFQNCILSAASQYPETKQELTNCLKNGGCTGFRPFTKTHDYLPPGWESLPNTTHVTKVKCFREYYLEPYTMVRKTSNLPLFTEKFINYGFNKVQWIEHLRYSGYEFHVLSQAFAVDMPHPSSKYAKVYNKDYRLMLTLYRRFLTDMRANSKDQSRQLICKCGS